MREYLVWFSAGDAKHFGNFRLHECEAVDQMVYPGRDPSTPLFLESYPDHPMRPYAIVSFPDEATAVRFISRTVLTYALFEVWASSTTSTDDLVARAAAAAVTDPCKAGALAEHESLCVRTRAFGRKLTRADHVEMIQKVMTGLPFKGPVQLNDPDNQFWVLLNYETLDAARTADKRLHKCFLARKVADSAVKMMFKYDLKHRPYIGTTSTKAELAFLMANQAHVQSHSLVYDPFVGTGSIIVSAAVFGATVFGSDIDIRVLHGDEDTGTNIRSNFKGYGLPRPELLRSDNSIPVWRPDLKFDAIVCDPPYGIREGARKSGAVDAHPVEEHYRDTHIPRTQAYHAVDLMRDLLEFGARHLELGGRLAYLLPCTHEYTDAELPTHPCFEVIANSEQVLALKFRRRLITMKKVSEPGTSAPAVQQDQGVEPSYSKIRQSIREPRPCKRKEPSI